MSAARPEPASILRRPAHRARDAARRFWLHPRGPAAVALAVLAAAAAFYLTGLASWLVNDDEGSYLYAAWRIALGELPYRDFLTPQLPAFLFPGGALMRLTGPEAWPARALAVAAALGAGAVWWVLFRRLFGPFVALVGMAAFLLHPDVYAASRTFRAEPFMLLWQALGALAFARAVLPRPERTEPPRRAWLVASGACFGLATLAKLFGPWPLAGLLLWLLDDGRRRARPWRATWIDAALAVAACGAVVAAGMAALALAAGPSVVWEATVGHHVRQGASKPLAEVLGEGVALFGLYLRDANRAVPAVLAAAVAGHALRRGTRGERLLGWPLVTAAGLLLLTRDRYPRHLLYLAPFVAGLFALAVHRLTAIAPRDPADARWPRLAAAALVVAVLGSWRLYDRDYVQARAEDGTMRVADVLSLLTAPGEAILSDYSELNFYARRPTTYSAASLSSGAVQSGQIDWPRLAEEIRQTQPPALLTLELDSPESHLRYLSPADHAAFEAWRDARYAPAGTLVRTAAQRYAVYAPKDRPLPVLARFEGAPTLLAAAPGRDRVSAGDSVDLRTAWLAPDGGPTAGGRLAVTVRLVDDRGRAVAQSDAGLLAAGGRDVAAWSADELSALRVPLRVPPGLPPGTYDLRLGLYASAAEGEAASGALDDPSRNALDQAARDEDAPAADLLPARDAAGVDLGPTILVGRIEVAAWRPGPLVDEARALGLNRPPDALRQPAGGLAWVGTGALPAATVAAGEVVPVALAWRVTAPPRAGTVRVALVEPESGAVAADRQLALGEAGTPSSSWPEGAVVERVVLLPVRADAAAARYAVVVELWDASGRRVGEPAVPIGHVDVAARDISDRLFDPHDLPPMQPAVQTTLGDVGTFVGAYLVRRADVITASLVWRAQAPSDVPLHATLQLLGPDGRPVAQHDGPPAGGNRPTTGWLPGEYVVDMRSLVVPEALVDGAEIELPLVAAIYEPLTGKRLPATEPVGDGLVEVARVKVGAR